MKLPVWRLSPKGPVAPEEEEEETRPPITPPNNTHRDNIIPFAPLTLIWGCRVPRGVGIALPGIELGSGKGYGHIGWGLQHDCSIWGRPALPLQLALVRRWWEAMSTNTLSMHAVLRRLGLEGQVSPEILKGALAAEGLEVCSKRLVCCPVRICEGCHQPMPMRECDRVNASVLTLEGWQPMDHIPLRCRRRGCELEGKRVWYNFITIDEGDHRWRWDDSAEMHYFFVCNAWGVETAWLRQFTHRLALQHISFRTEAEVFTRAAVRTETEHLVPAKAHLKLERAWICWRVMVRAFHCAAAPRNVNLQQNVVSLLQSIWHWYPSYMLERRAQVLRDHGVTAKTAVVDGNAKLARRICARACAELMHSQPLGKYTATQCSEKPAFRLRCCRKHMPRPQAETTALGQSEIIVAHRRRRVLDDVPVAEPYDVCLASRDMRLASGLDHRTPRRWVPASWMTQDMLQEYWDGKGDDAFVPVAAPLAARTATSCKTHKEDAGRAERRKKCRCGWLYACTPEGYILHLKEYVGAESLPQRYFFLADVVEKYASVAVVRHDDACHLRRYADGRAGDSAAALRLAFPNIQYITDGLHSRNHIDPWCLANCSPKAECNRDLVAGENSQACEQLFSLIGKHKHSVRSMGRLTSHFFLIEMADVLNKAWADSRHAPAPQASGANVAV